MTAGRSALQQAAALRAESRRGLWRRLLARLGFKAPARRAHHQAGRWQLGAQAEAATAALLAPLEREGWHIRHDLALPHSTANLDHVLVTPGGTLIVLDTKRWHRGRTTRIIHGRVRCGADDRHRQVEAVARYATQVAQALGLSPHRIRPLLVVHGSRIEGGQLTVRACGGNMVEVIGANRLVAVLRRTDKGHTPKRAAHALANRVDCTLLPYDDASRRNEASRFRRVCSW